MKVKYDLVQILTLENRNHMNKTPKIIAIHCDSKIRLGGSIT